MMGVRRVVGIGLLLLVAAACSSGTTNGDGGLDASNNDAANGCSGTCVMSGANCPSGTAWNHLEPLQSGCPEEGVGQICCVPVVDAGAD